MFEAQVRKIVRTTIKPIDLRHTAASLMLAAGVSAKVVQERLGHSSIVVTMDLYSHVAPTMQREAADRLAAVIDG